MTKDTKDGLGAVALLLGLAVLLGWLTNWNDVKMTIGYNIITTGAGLLWILSKEEK